ncbi:MAG: trypsin-like peptidase domain-containing protein [Chloroflexi bacterium]|nr:trypsin-like peptidase domain-containing protein [Chloroflexota bacterium]
MANVVTQLNAEMSDAIAGARRSLVEIRNGRGAGSGIVWRSDGLIVTNAHVVAGRHHLNVILPDKREFPARVLALDTQHDLAALAIDARDLPAIELGDARGIQAGEWVMALGHPWGVIGAVTSGIVIGEGAQFPEMPASGREWVVVSLHLRPGHSGGPLLDKQGKLVGINTMITGPDVGVAIPVNVAREFLRRAGLAETIKQHAPRGEYV